MAYNMVTFSSRNYKFNKGEDIITYFILNS